MEITEDGASQNNFKRVKWNSQRDLKHYYVDNHKDMTPLSKKEIPCASYHNELVPKCLCREGDTPSRSLPRVAIPMESRFTPLARDMVQMEMSGK